MLPLLPEKAAGLKLAVEERKCMGALRAHALMGIQYRPRVCLNAHLWLRKRVEQATFREVAAAMACVITSSWWHTPENKANRRVDASKTDSLFVVW